MLKNRKITLVAFALLLAGLAFGLVHLVQLRFNVGDIYPPYSTLRADPLGAKAFYEGIENLPRMKTQRLFGPLPKNASDKDNVLFVLGLSRYELNWMQESDFKDISRFVYGGGRLVISLLPQNGDSFKEEMKQIKEDNKDKKKDDKKKKSAKPKPKSKDKTFRHDPDDGPGSDSGDMFDKWVSFDEKFDLKTAISALGKDEDGHTSPELAFSTNGLAPAVSWHSGVYFTDAKNKWRVIYSRKKYPVMVERSFGQGSMVLATDTYFLSNEAMRKERHAELLAWLVGSKHNVMFDEEHLGLEQKPGIAMLFRQYHLQGLLYGLILLALLFVWKNSVAFVPPYPDESSEGDQGLVEGRESSADFVNLLRRNIPPSDILARCFAEWQAACGRGARVHGRLDSVKRILAEDQAQPAASRHPVETYQSIQNTLTRKL